MELFALATGFLVASSNIGKVVGDWKMGDEFGGLTMLILFIDSSPT